MLNHDFQRGFSIIELSIAITIMAILIALGIPSMSNYIQSARLGTMAKSFYTGVQMARTEAIRLNQAVDFVITSTPIAGGIETSAVADASGKNWVVRYADKNNGGALTLVEAKSALEGGGGSMAATSSVGVMTFTALGAKQDNAAAQIDISNPAAGICSASVVCWRVAVSAGGQVRLCNPMAPASAVAGDTRGC